MTELFFCFMLIRCATNVKMVTYQGMKDRWYPLMAHDLLLGRLRPTKLFIRFTASAFRKLPSFYVFSYFPFGFEGRMWDLIVSVPDHCLSFYFAKTFFCLC